MLNKVNDMSERDFVYWLQGFFELRKPGPITREQSDIIEEHLALVLTKKTQLSMNYKTFTDPGVVYNIGNSDVPESC